MVTDLTLFTLLLSRPQKRILTDLAVMSGLSRAAVIRQLLLREHQAPRNEKTLATREAR